VSKVQNKQIATHARERKKEASKKERKKGKKKKVTHSRANFHNTHHPGQSAVEIFTLTA